MATFLYKFQYLSLAKKIKLLEMAENNLRLPHSKSLGNGLFELRERVYGYRLYYLFLSQKKIILIKAGNKNTQKNDIKYARGINKKLKEEVGK